MRVTNDLCHFVMFLQSRDEESFTDEKLQDLQNRVIDGVKQNLSVNLKYNSDFYKPVQGFSPYIMHILIENEFFWELNFN